jgi:hypothetical protein
VPADEIKELYGVETLEEAFFAATGPRLRERHEKWRWRWHESDSLSQPGTS